MFRSLYRTYIPVLVILIFGFQAIFYSPHSYAQTLMKSNDVPGGTGTAGQSQDTGGSTSTLLIVGGVIIAGLLIYTLVIKKEKPEEGEKQDSASTQSLLPGSNSLLAAGTVSENLRRMQQIPVNLYFGFQKANPVLPERKFILGITCNF